MFNKIMFHRITIIAFFALLILSPSSPVSAGNNTWTHVGLAGETIHALVIHPLLPGTLFAGTDHGIFKSTNSGEDWTPINSGLSGTRVTHLIIDPVTSTTFYATIGDTVYVSTTSGDHWDPAWSAGYTIRAFAIAPSDPSTWYLSDSQTTNGVYRVTGGGSHWAYAGLTTKNVTNLAVDPTSSTTVYAGTLGDAMWKSTDGGGHWTIVGSLPTPVILSLVIVPTTPPTIYAGTSIGLARSTNGGGTWDIVNAKGGFMGHPLIFDPTMQTTLYVGFSSNVIDKGTDSGSTWAPLGGDVYFDGSFQTLAVDPSNPGNVYAGTGGDGVYVLRQFNPHIYLPRVVR